MKIRITEKQEQIIAKHILKEAMGFGFSLGYLKTLTSFKKRLEYCKEYLGFPIGRGSSRICFQLDDERILKFAYNQKGIAQNEEEFRNGQDSYITVVPKVYAELSDTENFTFIVSEYVLPAKEEDFEAICGVDFTTFTHVIKTVESWYGSYKKVRYLKDEDIEQLCDDSEDISDFVNYVSNYQPSTGDMMRIANYGIVSRNGEACIVLLDSGLNDEIYNKFYYKRKR